MGFVTEERNSGKCAIDVLGDLRKTLMIKAIKLCPKVLLWNPNDVKLL